MRFFFIVHAVVRCHSVGIVLFLEHHQIPKGSFHQSLYPLGHLPNHAALTLNFPQSVHSLGIFGRPV